MKTIVLFACMLVSTGSYSQFKLKRLLRELAVNQDSIDVITYEKKLDNIRRPWNERNDFLKEFCKARLSVKYNSLDHSMAETKGTVSLDRLQDRARRLLERWEEDISMKDTNYINTKYPYVIKTIRGWYNDIQDEIERRQGSDTTTLQDEENIQSRIKELEDSLAKVKYTDEYYSTERLKLVSNEFNDFMSEITETDPDGNELTYRIIYERSGPGGTDLIITIQPNFQNHQKYFERGVYQYEPINNVFEFFAIGVRDKIEDSTVIEAWVTGEADGYPLLKNNSTVSYQSMSEIWGNISATTYSGKQFNLSPNERINNEELAFLRAWNAKYILEKVIGRECVTRITAIDYSVVNPSKKDAEGTYRNATIKVFLLDYFFTNYENLIDQPEGNIYDKIIHDNTN